jgi:ribosomal protein L29
MKTVEELKNLRKKSSRELVKDLIKENNNLAKLKFSLGFMKLKNFRQITQIRKKIARILTILSEKIREEGNEQK